MTSERREPSLANSIYEALVNEEDARACQDISDAACRETPGNFMTIMVASALTKLGDALANPKTVLPWIVTSTGAPALVLSLLVPIRESGSLIPQLFIGGAVRRLSRRKWAWIVGAALQACAVAGMGFTAMTLTGTLAGISLLGCLILFSLARGLCSVAGKDVLGKTVPKGRRGQLTGWSSSFAALISTCVGLLFLLSVVDAASSRNLALLLLIAGCLWMFAAAAYAQIIEQPGATEGGSSAAAVARENLLLIVTDKPFRQFVIARSLLMCSALSAPYYVALAQSQANASGSLLGAFMLAGGTASMLSAPFWGRFADRSSRQVMFWAASTTALVGVIVFLLDHLDWSGLNTLWGMPLAYFVLSIAHSGVRVGRKTYVVDLAGGDKRTAYVSVSNSIIGCVLLLLGLTGLFADQIGNAGMIGLFAAMGCLGALLTRQLREI